MPSDALTARHPQEGERGSASQMADPKEDRQFQKNNHPPTRLPYAGTHARTPLPLPSEPHAHETIKKNVQDKKLRKDTAERKWRDGTGGKGKDL